MKSDKASKKKNRKSMESMSIQDCVCACMHVCIPNV